MPLMQGKKGLVFGVANDRSYAWYITQQLIAAGAQCAFTHLPDPKGKMERRCRKAVSLLGDDDPWMESMDAGSDEELDRVFARIESDGKGLDFLGYRALRHLLG